LVGGVAFFFCGFVNGSSEAGDVDSGGKVKKEKRESES
jgi:hypothetical protein